MTDKEYKKQWRAKQKAKKEADFAELSAYWVPLPPDSKKCSKCKTLKGFSCFPKQSDKKFGLSTSCRVCHSEKNRELMRKDPEKIRARNRNYKKNNPDKIREAARVYSARKCKSDPIFRIKKTLRIRLIETLGYRKSKKSFEYFGCSVDILKAHLQAQFKDGMTWENHGQFGWHIDHIRPISSFDLNNQEDVSAAFHYTNLQPLWWQDNLKKGSKVNHV